MHLLPLYMQWDLLLTIAGRYVIFVSIATLLMSYMLLSRPSVLLRLHSCENKEDGSLV